MALFAEMASGLWHYWFCIALMMTGLYIVIARENLVKKMMGLNIFQVAVIMLYVSMAKVTGGTAPILIGYEAPHGEVAHHGEEAPHGEQAHGEQASAHGQAEASADHGDGGDEQPYSNPLPHVLMLTAIVVGVATTALGLALIVRIQEAYGTVEEDDIVAMDLEQELLGR